MSTFTVLPALGEITERCKLTNQKYLIIIQIIFIFMFQNIFDELKYLTTKSC